jgi:hypothetical protein
LLLTLITTDTAKLTVAPVVVGAHPVAAASNIPGILSGVASICSAVIWPLVIVMVLWMFRAEAVELLKAAVGVAEGATRFRIWQIEFDKDVSQQVAQSASFALTNPIVPHVASVSDTQAATNITPPQLAAAADVRSLLDAAPNSTLRKSAEAAIKTRMLGFAQEYETTRASMGPGPDRTRAMNSVVSKMRTLALAADIYLDIFMGAANSPGQRLAAVCILQLKPQMSAVSWLVERMHAEQPFVFFHAAIALLNAVRRFGSGEQAALTTALDSAVKQVQGYGEQADANTLRVLSLAQSELSVSA